jgi:hypothetical protein
MSDTLPMGPPVPGPPDPTVDLPQFDHAQPPDATEQALRRGLRYVHAWNSRSREDIWASRMAVQTLIDLLTAKGVITAEELNGQSEITGPAVQELFQSDPMAPYLDPTPDKYVVQSPDINCAERLHLCQARCCTLRFALSTQDLSEGIVRWEYARPYVIAQRTDGYCTHCQPSTFACGVYQNRPAVCRTYDCRQDKRIWRDFDNYVPADPADIDNEALKPPRA